MDKHPTTLTQAFLKYFGKKPGQSMSDFSAELKAATETPELKQFWIDQFNANTEFQITP